MGRAIVRRPQVFLMDEPLSNLDAKLRVQMRAEISQLQNDLGVTTVYVTHDQVEAMTMGDRVAVMRKGELQQVATPQEVYDRPVNLFVGGFIGSPVDEPARGAASRREGDGLVRGARRAAPDAGRGRRCEARPRIRDYVGRTVVLGIRPESVEDAALATDAPADRRLSGTVELREALGSEIVAHVRVPASVPAYTEDVRELAEDIGAARGRRARGWRRRADRRPPVGPRPGAGGGAAPSWSSTPSSCTSSTPIRGSPSTTRYPNPGRWRMKARARTRCRCWRCCWWCWRWRWSAAACGGDDDERRRHRAAERRRPPPSRSAARSASPASGPVTSRRRSRPSSTASPQEPRTSTVKYTSAGDNLPTVLATAVQGGNPPDVAIDRPARHDRATSSRPATLKPHRLRPADAAAELRARAVDARRASNGKLYGVLFKAANKSLVWYNVPVFEDAGVKPPRPGRTSPQVADTIKASGVPALLRRRRRRLAAHRPVREHLPAHRGPGECTTSSPSTRSSGPTRR